MDSGIESTESSNGSMSDTCINVPDIHNEEMRNSSHAVNSSSLQEKTPSNSDDYLFREPLTTKLNSKCIKSFIQFTSNGHNAKFESTWPNDSRNDILLSTQASEPSYKIENSLPLKESSNLLEAEVEEGKASYNLLSIPRELPSNFEEFQVPELPVPEGCRLKLNFPKIETEIIIPEQAMTFETIPMKSGLLQWPSNPQPYAGSMAILPYESRDLQRKFRYYRKRLRQIISTKPKEKNLRLAASVNNVENVERYLKEGVNPNATDEKGRTALHIAASKGYATVVKLLLLNRADPNQKDSIGNTALHLAACTSHIETVTPLLKAGTDLKQADNQGYSPLHLANSRLKLLQKDPNPMSENLKKQVYQIVEMMQEYLKCSGNTEEAEMLTALTKGLTLSDDSSTGEEDLKQLLNSLQDLTLSKTTTATTIKENKLTPDRVYF